MAICAVPRVGADGMLDPSFGNGGLVTTAFPGSFPQDVALSLMVMPDGRAVAAGSTNINLIQTDIAVARYLFSGDLDTTFGGDGRVTIPFPQQGGSYSTAEAVLLQADGRLVLVGGTVGDFFASFALARLNADGSLDPSFGTGGLVTAPANAVAATGLLQPDGRIVAAGATGTSSIMVARYNADGSLDPTFGGDGTVTVTVPGSFDVQAVVLQPDGKLVIAGTSPTGFSLRNFGLVRLLPDGALDTSFGGDGIVSSDFGAIETGFSVILLPDGRLVVAGARTLMATPTSPVDIALARYLPDGSVDTTFGTGGVVIASMSPVEWATQLMRLPDGKLLAAGSIFRKKGDFLLARFLPDGVLDSTFGVDGFLRTNFEPNSPDECNAAALAGPDLVLTVGTTTPAGRFDSDYALARYIVTTGGEVTSGVE
jgi:uncharacterized delta-60 repeat protein